LYIGNRFLRGQFTADGKDLLIENDHEIIIDIDLNEKVKKRRVIELEKIKRKCKK
jgi:hypothetical protein